MADFDTEAAKAAGYSDGEISKILNGIKAARAAGYSDGEISAHLSGGTNFHAVSGNPPPPSMPHGTPSPSGEPPLSTAMAGLGRQVGILGTGAVEGAINTLALPDRLSALGNSLLPQSIQSTASALSPAINLSRGIPPGTTNSLVPNLEAAATSLGAANNPNFAPSGPGERFEHAAGEGLGGAAMTLPFGGVGAGIRTLIGGVASGLAGEAAHEAFPSSTLAPILGGLAASTAGITLGSILGGNRLEAVAKQLGDSTTMQQSGDQLQSAVRDWKSNVLPMKLDALASPLDSKLSHNPSVDLTEFESTLHSMTTKAGTAQPLSDLLTSRLPGQLSSRLASLPVGTIINSPSGDHISIPAIPYLDARALRSDLGQLMANPKLIPGADQSTIKGLYRALSSDIGTTASANGASSEWDSFNQGSNKLYSTAEGPMSRVASDINPTNDTINPETAATRLLSSGKKGGSDLQALRTEVPTAVDELAAGHLRTNPGLWPKLSPEAQAALIPNESHRAIVDSATRGGAKPLASLAHVNEAALSGAAGDLAAHALGMFPGSPEIPALVGIAAPAVARGLKNIVTNPEKLAYPATGAIAGNAVNPLTGPAK